MASGSAVSALVLGIIGLILFWIPILGLVLCLLAVIFGGVSVRKNGGGIAIAGLVLGIIGLIISGLVTFVALVFEELLIPL